MMMAYNLRRIINIVGINALKDWLEKNTIAVRFKIKRVKLRSSHLINHLLVKIVRPEIIIKLVNCLYLTKKQIASGGF